MPKIRPLNTNVKDSDIDKFANRCNEVSTDQEKLNKGMSRISVSFSKEEMKKLK